MGRRLPVYGLDIEVDTSIDGLDPARSCVRTVALSFSGLDEEYTGPEHEVLADLDARLAGLEPGVIATWNGAAFDLPFLADRAGLWDMRLGLVLQPDRGTSAHLPMLHGHPCAYRATWHQHGHIDAYRLYGHDDTDVGAEVLHACARSDARLARALVERRWATAARHVDRLGDGTSSVAS